MGCTDSAPDHKDNAAKRPASSVSDGGMGFGTAASIAPPKTAPSATTGVLVEDSLLNSSRGGSPNPMRASDVPEAIRDGDSVIFFPTHNRRRGSSVRLVMKADDPLVSPKNRSPPSKVFEQAAQKMEALELAAGNISPLSGSIRPDGSHSPGNPLAIGRLAGDERDENQQQGDSDTPTTQTVHVQGAIGRRDSLSSNSGVPSPHLGGRESGTLPDEDGDDDVIPTALQMKSGSNHGSFGPLASSVSMGISMTDAAGINVNDVNAHHQGRTASSRRDNPFSGSMSSSSSIRACDVAGEAGVTQRGTSLVIPTHTRKRGSSVSLVMEPDQHLVSPRHKSPPQKTFEDATETMDKLDLS